MLAFAHDANTKEEWEEQRIDLELLSSYFFDFGSEVVKSGVIKAFNEMFPK